MAVEGRAFRGALGDADLRLLRVFRAVVEAGGLSAAESVLNVGRSTISTHIADLERRLHMRLCRRGRGGFALTEHGQVVYDATLKLLASLEDFRAEVNGAHAQLAGELNLAFVEHSTRHPGFRLDAALRAFSARAPGVHVNLEARGIAEIEQAVLHGRLHVGIVIANRRLAGLNYRYLLSEIQAPFCAKGHPLFDRPDASIGLDEIASQDYVSRSYIDESKARQGYLRGAPAATAHNLEAVVTLILSGRYIGIMPTDFPEEWVRRGMIRAIRPDLTSYSRDFEVVTRKGTPPTPVVAAFLGELFKSHQGAKPPAPRPPTPSRRRR